MEDKFRLAEANIIPSRRKVHSRGVRHASCKSLPTHCACASFVVLSRSLHVYIFRVWQPTLHGRLVYEVARDGFLTRRVVFTCVAATIAVPFRFLHCRSVLLPHHPTAFRSRHPTSPLTQPAGLPAASLTRSTAACPPIRLTSHHVVLQGTPCQLDICT